MPAAGGEGGCHNHLASEQADAYGRIAELLQEPPWKMAVQPHLVGFVVELLAVHLGVGVEISQHLAIASAG